MSNSLKWRKPVPYHVFYIPDANGNYLVTMGLFDTVLYDVVEIPDMKEYTMRITLNDPAASISKDFRIQVDYILFEPIN